VSVGGQVKSFVWSKLEILTAREALARDEMRANLVTHVAALLCCVLELERDPLDSELLVVIWGFGDLVADFWTVLFFKEQKPRISWEKLQVCASIDFAVILCFSCMKVFENHHIDIRETLGQRYPPSDTGCRAFLILPTTHRACYNCRE